MIIKLSKQIDFLTGDLILKCDRYESIQAYENPVENHDKIITSAVLCDINSKRSISEKIELLIEDLEKLVNNVSNFEYETINDTRSSKT